ncbi:MFS transporter [Lacisediminihabitans sp.]|jgi:MFS family permease|uniref:MFS transporter n=1 Tax=Lacisediminihabitans sp. TaxID=2787631 RepID=UPI002F95F0C4
MTTPETAHAPAPFAEPHTRVPGRWIALFAAAWLGVWMAQLTPIQLLLPLQIEARVHSADWVDSVVAFGVVSGIAGVFALVTFPLTGALSDRTTSRFGRRRPWILGGALVFAVGLIALGAQTSILGIGVFWSVALIGFCVLSAALTAMISDQVPVNQRGYVSGWISAPQAIGTILGLLLVVVLGLSIFAGYTLVAVLVLLLVLPFVLGVPDAVLSPVDRPPLTGRGLVAGFWISPREHPDFGWTLLSRILVNFGNAFGTALLLQFLQYGLHRPHAKDDLLVLVFVYLVFVVIASLVSGRLSDRLGRRKAFVFAAAALQGVAALLLAFVPEFAVAIVAAGILGLGYGCFLSVDQALATQVLPDARTRGKDLGIMNIATAVPQAIAPLIGAFVVAASAGFQSLFVLSALAALLGAAAVLPIRSVR